MTAHTPTTPHRLDTLDTFGTFGTFDTSSARRAFSRRHLLATLAAGSALALVLAACGERADDTGSESTTPGSTPASSVPEPTPPPTTDGGSTIAYPTDADAVVLRLGYENGFVTQEYAFTKVPTVLITGDGRIITQAPTTAQYPGPLVAPLEVRTISPEGIATLLRLADQAGLLGAIPDYTAALNIADAPDTVLTLRTADGTYVHSAYALGLAIDADGNPTDEATPARQALAEYVAGLTDLESIVGADALGTSSILEPTGYRLRATAVDESSLEGYDVEPTLADWPTATGLALADAADCALVTAEAAGDVFTEATSLTFFRDGGVLYSLAVATQLPGDGGCEPTP